MINKDIDFNSKKYMIMLIAICVLFFVLVIKAFEYIPDADNDIIKRKHIENINTPADVAESENDADDEAEDDVDDEEEVELIEPEAVGMMEIEAPKGIGIKKEETATVGEATDAADISKEDKALIALNGANKLRISNKKSEALKEYMKIPEMTDDKMLIASSYEGIAMLYAAEKRYGTALSYAAKAYNLSPSISNQLLLARIYYRTGDTDKSVNYVNNILRRDFSAE